MAPHNLIGPVMEHFGGTVPIEGFGWRRMRCPFHDDRTASASIHFEGNAFNCHVCGVKGDVYSIVMQREGVGFADSLRIVEDITGIRDEQFRGGTSDRPPLPDESGHLRGQGTILASRVGLLPDDR